MSKTAVVLGHAFILVCLVSCDRPAPPPASQPDGPEPQSQGAGILSRTPPPLFTTSNEDGDSYINRVGAN